MGKKANANVENLKFKLMCNMQYCSFQHSYKALNHYRPLAVNIYLVYKLNLTSLYSCWKGFIIKILEVISLSDPQSPNIYMFN